MGILDKSPPRDPNWAATRWSVLSNLDSASEPKRELAWTILAESYRHPLELYARRRLARAPGGVTTAADAPDVVQDFLATCLEKEWLSRADPEQGRFRAYVQFLLRRYINGWIRYRLARKRHPGEGRHVLSLLPEDEEEAAASPDPADLEDFDRSWTQVAVDRALEKLEACNEREYVVIRDLIDTEGEGSADLPERLGVRNRNFPVVKHRAKQRFSELFRKELRSTVLDDELLEEEWRLLQPYMP